MDYEPEQEDTKQTAVELIKKWHRSGFISVSYWAHAGKVIIEIGSTDPNKNNALVSASKCYLPVNQFLAYLRAEVHGQTARLFAQFEEKGVSFFGGSPKLPVVSRIFNSKIYVKDGNPDGRARTFTCAHYEGRVQDKGVVIPDFKKQISYNTMKITLTDIAEIFETLSNQVIAEKIVKLYDERNR